MNPKELRRTLFDDITALIKDISLSLAGLQDKYSTSKQRRHIQRVQKKLVIFEMQDVQDLKKDMEI
jgi:hypothetical protein